jgi:hypothetical protein
MFVADPGHLANDRLDSALKGARGGILIGRLPQNSSPKVASPGAHAGEHLKASPVRTFRYFNLNSIPINIIYLPIFEHRQKRHLENSLPIADPLNPVPLVDHDYECLNSALPAPRRRFLVAFDVDVVMCGSGLQISDLGSPGPKPVCDREKLQFSAKILDVCCFLHTVPHELELITLT